MSRKKTKSARKSATRRVPLARKRKGGGKIGPAGRTEFLQRAWTMEIEAAERYASFADAMDQHNNREVAELFRKLARIEQLHADQLLEENFAKSRPTLPPEGLRWDTGGEGPETAAPEELHYRMQPYHALQIALTCEKKAHKFFTGYASRTADAKVRKAAREMAEEEAEHVQLVEEWLKRTHPPDKDWEHDPDPPFVSD